jgi:hypothetical protein
MESVRQIVDTGRDFINAHRGGRTRPPQDVESCGLAHELIEVDRQERQVLAEIVVEFAGDARALLLLCGIQPTRLRSHQSQHASHAIFTSFMRGWSATPRSMGHRAARAAPRRGRDWGLSRTMLERLVGITSPLTVGNTQPRRRAHVQNP